MGKDIEFEGSISASSVDVQLKNTGGVQIIGGAYGNKFSLNNLPEGSAIDLQIDGKVFSGHDHKTKGFEDTKPPGIYTYEIQIR